MDWYLVQQAVTHVGLGPRVHVDFKPVTQATAYYLANYLTKGDKLRGVRQWANIGTYDGIGKRDILQTSERIEAIKAWQIYFRAMGDHRFVAYGKAVQNVDNGIPLPGEAPPF